MEFVHVTESQIKNIIIQLLEKKTSHHQIPTRPLHLACIIGVIIRIINYILSATAGPTLFKHV